MSFLNLRKNKKEEKSAAKRAAVVPVAPRKLVVSDEKEGAPDTPSLFIERPRVSEKATALAAEHCFVFEVSRAANKRQIAHAITARYKVTPLAVRMLAIPTKTIFARGKRGTTGGGKKAYVFLKKGDKIEL